MLESQQLHMAGWGHTTAPSAVLVQVGFEHLPADPSQQVPDLLLCHKQAAPDIKDKQLCRALLGPLAVPKHQLLPICRSHTTTLI